MLHTLPGPDQSQIGGGVVHLPPFVDHFLAFVDQTRHAFARFGPCAGSQYTKTLEELLDLGLGLLKMGLQEILQLHGVGRPLHAWQRFEKLLFGMKQVTQLLHQQVPHWR